MLQDGRTKIAVSLTEETTEGVVSRMADLRDVADLFEVRADFVRDLDLGALLRARTKPILFTCRPESEGGRWPDRDHAARRRLLSRGGRARRRPRGRGGPVGLRGRDRVEGGARARPLVARPRGHAGGPRRRPGADGGPSPRRRQDRGDRPLGGRPRPADGFRASPRRGARPAPRRAGHGPARGRVARPRRTARGPVHVRLGRGRARGGPGAAGPRACSPTPIASGRSARPPASTAFLARTSSAASPRPSRTAPSPSGGSTPSTFRCRRSRWAASSWPSPPSPSRASASRGRTRARSCRTSTP